jgi:hypothetical protein
MLARVSVRLLAGSVVLIGILATAHVVAQQPAQGAGGRGGGGGRPAPATLTMKVEWQATKGTEQVPVVQGTVVDSNLELKQYGSGKKLLNPGGGDASTVWSGECDTPFAITFRAKDHAMDLTGNQARIRWAVKTSGFHVVRPVVRLTDGTMFVGDSESASVPMLTIREVALSDVRWIKLDPERVVTVNSGSSLPTNEIWAKPDLSKVEEVGFADLIPGSGHGTGGYIHLGSIEVYGRSVPRAANTASR